MSIKQLDRLKQSIWVDHLSRDYLENGGLESHIRKGVSGITSNPSILRKAIVGSDTYTKEIQDLAQKGCDSIDIYEELVRRDIRIAAQLLYSVYICTNGLDGYVSIEVDPAFSHRVDAAVYQGAHLYNLIDRPNIMIKVPGTEAGIEAFKRLIFDGISVNITLLFSVDQYERVAWAYIDALEARKADGNRVDNVASVASFFISRIDVAINNILDSWNGDIAKRRDELWGKAAIASAKLAYEKWHEITHHPRFIALQKEGAHPQRLLWASTSNKYPQEDPLKYVFGLIAAETVNTLPLKTLDAIIKCKDPLTDALNEEYHWNAQEHMEELAGLRIKMHEYMDRLQEDGIRFFADDFDELMSCLYHCVSERGEHVSRNSEFGP